MKFKNGDIVICMKPVDIKNLHKLYRVVNYRSHSQIMSVESLDRSKFYNCCTPYDFELYNFQYNSVKDLL